MQNFRLYKKSVAVGSDIRRFGGKEAKKQNKLTFFEGGEGYVPISIFFIRKRLSFGNSASKGIEAHHNFQFRFKFVDN